MVVLSAPDPRVRFLANLVTDFGEAQIVPTPVRRRQPSGTMPFPFQTQDEHLRWWVKSVEGPGQTVYSGEVLSLDQDPVCPLGYSPVLFNLDSAFPWKDPR